jgi:hypothetical protein
MTEVTGWRNTGDPITRDGYCRIKAFVQLTSPQGNVWLWVVPEWFEVITHGGTSCKKNIPERHPVKGTIQVKKWKTSKIRVYDACVIFCI